jgi:hypothetical protein
MTDRIDGNRQHDIKIEDVFSILFQIKIPC